MKNAKNKILILLSLLSVLFITVGGLLLFNFPENASADEVTSSRASSVADTPYYNGTFEQTDSDDIFNRGYGNLTSRFLRYSDSQDALLFRINLNQDVYDNVSNRYNHLFIYFGSKINIGTMLASHKNGLFYFREKVSNDFHSIMGDSGSIMSITTSYFDVYCKEFSKSDIFVEVNPVDRSSIYYIDLNISLFGETGIDGLENIYELGNFAVFGYYFSSVGNGVTGYGITKGSYADIKQDSLSYVENILTYYSVTALKNAHKCIGIYREGDEADSDIDVRVRYKTLTEGSYYCPDTVTKVFSVPWYYYRCKDKIVSLLYSSLRQFKNLSSFNVSAEIVDNINNSTLDVDSRIMLQATGFTYTYDYDANSFALEVVYNSFNAENYFIVIRSNDFSSDTANLRYCVYPLSTFDDSMSGYKGLVFDVETIEAHGKNSLSWTTSLSALADNRFYFDGVEYNEDNERYEDTAKDVIIKKNRDGIIVYVKNGKDDKLFNVGITIVADIVPDTTEYTVTYKYLYYDESMEAEEMDSDAYSMTYGDLLALSFGTFYNTYKSVLDEGVANTQVGGDFYCSLTDDDGKGHISKSWDHGNLTCLITVNYYYTSTIRFYCEQEESYSFYIFSNGNISKNFSDMGIEIPSGCRLLGFKNCSSGLTISQNDNGWNFKVSEISSKNFYECTFDLSDVWPVKITYLEPYTKNDSATPFAVRKEQTINLNVEQYNDINNLTIENIATILGFSSMNILKSAASINSDNIVLNPTTRLYEITVEYTSVSVTQIGNDGDRQELLIPLSCYGDWLNLNGVEFSIMWLNTPTHKYFKYTNDVEKEDLYGYFAVAIFEEKQTDINHFFRNQTSGGCAVLYESKTVKGSDFYQFLSKNKVVSSLLSVSLSGFAGLALNYGIFALCEINNDNREVYSYMFYYDPAESEPFIATNGAHNANDTSTAVGNAAENLGNSIEDFFANLKDNPVFNFIKILGLVIVSIFAVSIILKIIMWLFPSGPRRRR